MSAPTLQGHASSTLLELMRRTGYAFQQKNGQRIFGPPSTWTAGPPPRGCEVFVAKLPRYLFEDELFPLFSRAGTVYQMRLMVDFSGSNRGFGFVQFSRPEEARAAIALLDNHEVRPGRFIGVIRSIDNRRVYVGNLPKEMSKAQLADFFRGEVEGVVDVIVYQSVVKKPLNRGFVFLEFATHTDAAIARRKLKLICMEPGKQMIVDWAIPLPEVPDHVMREVKILYVRNLLLSTSETTLFEAMTSVVGNEIIKVKKINDFAFVHFTTRQAAEVALRFWNNKQLDGSIIEVTWAKPPQKSLQDKTFNRSASVQAAMLPKYNDSTLTSPVLRSSEGDCYSCNYENIYAQHYSFYNGANNYQGDYTRSSETSFPPGYQTQHFDDRDSWSQSKNMPWNMNNFGSSKSKQVV